MSLTDIVSERMTRFRAMAPLAVAWGISTTGLRLPQHKMIGVAFKIFSTEDGHAVASYDSLVRISKEEWEQRDRRSDDIHRITWEEIRHRGQEVGVIQEQVNMLFHVNGVTGDTAAFLAFNSAFNNAFIRQVFPGDFKKAGEGAGSVHRMVQERQRDLGGRRVVLEKDMGAIKTMSLAKRRIVHMMMVQFQGLPIALPIAPPHMHLVPVSRNNLMREFALPCDEEHYRHTDVVDDIHRIFCRVLPPPPAADPEGASRKRRHEGEGASRTRGHRGDGGSFAPKRARL